MKARVAKSSVVSHALALNGGRPEFPALLKLFLMLAAIPAAHAGAISVQRLSAVVLISVVAGVMNSIAGGGTLLTFPALVGLGIPPLTANATSTVALWPGSVTSMWGYRDALTGVRTWALGFAIPSLLGGVTGAWLLLHTPAARFAALVPWLVLAATALFIIQAPLMKAVRHRSGQKGAIEVDMEADARRTSGFPSAAIVICQFCFGIYGGYFGAGAGILMLAELGLMGLTNIHRMNGLKNWGGLCMNFIAAVSFAIGGLVDWRVALTMAVGAGCGGYLGSRVAQRVPQRAVRLAIIAIGLGSGIWLMF
jgi:uncharacterized protein